MANRAALFRAENDGRAVTRRGRNFIEFDLGGGRKRLVSTIEPLHYGPLGALEIDTTWTPTSGVWQHQMTAADFQARAKASFNGAPLVEYRVGDDFVTLQARQLDWTNDRGDVQLAGSVQGVSATATDATLRWTGAYGAGRHFEYTAHPSRLYKRILLDSYASLPAPSAQVLGGVNPVLRACFQFTRSATVTPFVDGQAWTGAAGSPTLTTASAIEFRRADGTVVFSFASPFAQDAVGETTPALMRVTRSGPNMLVEVRAPQPWLAAAAYPVVIDPTLNLQPDATDGMDSQISGAGAGQGANYGVSDTVSVGETNSVAGDPRHALIKFDLSSIPAGATINSATLSLYATIDASSNADTFRVYRLKRAWVEGTRNAANDSPATGVTWERYDTTNSWQTLGGTGANDIDTSSIGSRAFTAAETLNEFKDFPLTAAVKEDLDLGNGWLIGFDGSAAAGNNRYLFASSDNATAANRPKLVVDYTEAVAGQPMQRRSEYIPGMRQTRPGRIGF
jgi:hypothetical protein